MVGAMQENIDFASGDSDFADDMFCATFGDVLRNHHLVSNDAFTKDKFEHALVEVLRLGGREAELARRGNPGHDVTVAGEKWSLKTQADAAISPDEIYISKMRELGRGAWATQDDLAGLRKQMLDHLADYDRIFDLRCLTANRRRSDEPIHEYELVEIPKSLLMIEGGEYALQETSAQSPKPGRYTVSGEGGIAFELYFDGGTERKLQIRHLRKSLCRVHASWRFRR